MDHPDTLAGILCNFGEVEEAKKLRIQVQHWRKERLGMDHPDIRDYLTGTKHTLGQSIISRFADGKSCVHTGQNWTGH
jgi:hypothetical protein